MAIALRYLGKVEVWDQSPTMAYILNNTFTSTIINWVE